MKKKDLKELENMAGMLPPRFEYKFTGKATYVKGERMGEFDYVLVNHFNALKKMVARQPHKSVIDIFKEYYIINQNAIKAFNAKNPGKEAEAMNALKKMALADLEAKPELLLKTQTQTA